MVGTKKKITTELKNQIAQFCLCNSTNQVLHHGKVTEAALKFQVCKRTVGRVWTAAKAQIKEGNAVCLGSKKLGVPKPKRVLFDKEKMQQISFHKRATIRDLAHQLQNSKSIVGRLVKSNVIRPYTNAIKPQLTFKNKLQRIEFSLSQIQVDQQPTNIRFSDMKNVIHIDEKWFYMTRTTERYYLVPEETEPHMTTQSKRFIQKVMFIYAVCRPTIAIDGTVLFDGKIGIWPFTRQVPAQRKSINRSRGTLETKPIDSITKDVIKECLINKIIPAIKAKWSTWQSKDIIIQQDNAKSHVMDDDPDLRAAATADGFKIQLMCQPPNSPDMNINDLGWFRTIQSLQVETASDTVDQLVKNVFLSYESLEPSTLNNVFLSLQGCLIEVLKAKGDNNYRLPHIGKASLIRAGLLPTSLNVDHQLIVDSIQFLMESGHTEVWTYDVEGLLAALDSI